MAHSSTSTLRVFSSASKFTRALAAPFLFASIDLDRLDTSRLAEIFRDLSHLPSVRNLSCKVSTPYDHNTSYEKKNLQLKYVKLLLGLIGKRLKAFRISIKLGMIIDNEPDDVVGEAQHSEAVKQLITASDTYHVHLCYKYWMMDPEEPEIAWQIFSLPLMKELSADKVTRVKLHRYRSYYWIQNNSGPPLAAVEQDLRLGLSSFSNLKCLTLKDCRLSQYMSTLAVPGLTSLALLFSDFGSDEEHRDVDEVENNSSDLAASLSLITSSKQTLVTMYIKGLDIKPNENITLPHLHDLTIEECSPFPFLEYAHMPSLISLDFTSVPINLETLNTYLCNSKSRLRYFNIWECELGAQEDFANMYTLVKSSCERREIKLRLRNMDQLFDAWLDRDQIAAMAENVKDLNVALSSHSEARDYLHVIAPTLVELQLRLSVNLTEYSGSSHLATAAIMPFLKRFHAPDLCELAINFSAPTVDYLLDFHNAINSGSFREQFRCCTVIKGSITTDTESYWEAKDGRTKQMSGWLKENILKACKEYDIDITGLRWKNAKLVP